jgi:hypothetical protein
MIFYSDVADDLAQDSYSLLTTMVVYKGKQPSVADYITNVNNGTYTWTGIYLLQSYKDVDLTVIKVESVNKIKKNSVDGTLYGDYIGQSGLAEWAVLFDKTMSEGSNKLLDFNTSTKSMNFLRNITEDDLFMIVPVSNTSGEGVLRFDTIVFNGSVNRPIKQFTLNFS